MRIPLRLFFSLVITGLLATGVAVFGIAAAHQAIVSAKPPVIKVTEESMRIADFIAKAHASFCDCDDPDHDSTHNEGIAILPATFEGDANALPKSR